MSLARALRLYVVTDPGLAGSRGVIRTCEAALEAGAGFLQLRDKRASTRSLLATATVLAAVSRRYRCVFVVNDRVDVAMASGAQGVHLGADDMPPRLARSLMGPDAVIGVSVRSREEALSAWKDGADYLAANIVFPTPTKPDSSAPLGLEGVRRLAGATPLPLVAIGGINASNAGSVISSGADGVAVVSAVMAAEDPGGAVRELLEITGRLRPG